MCQLQFVLLESQFGGLQREESNAEQCGLIPDRYFVWSETIQHSFEVTRCIQQRLGVHTTTRDLEAILGKIKTSQGEGKRQRREDE
jgi:hypothetical protein